MTEQPRTRVTFIRDLRDLDAPGADEIATGVDLSEMQFTRDPDVPPLTLPPHVKSFEVARWPEGYSVRALDDDGQPAGEWLPFPGDQPAVMWLEWRESSPERMDSQKDFPIHGAERRP